MIVVAIRFQATTWPDHNMNDLSNRVYYVLIADDSIDDRFLLRNALLHTGRLKVVAEVSTGFEVISYLQGHRPFANRSRFPIPDLLLLDLKMPRKDGFEVLEWLSDQDLFPITIVVLTDSMEPQHIKKALDLGADLFEIKPHRIDERVAMMLALEDRLIQASMSLHRHLTVSPAA